MLTLWVSKGQDKNVRGALKACALLATWSCMLVLGDYGLNMKFTTLG